MRIQCILCDKVEHIDENSVYGKELRNNYLKLHLCKTCHKRIKRKTEERIKTGNFRLYREEKKEKYL